MCFYYVVHKFLLAWLCTMRDILSSDLVERDSVAEAVKMNCKASCGILWSLCLVIIEWVLMEEKSMWWYRSKERVWALVLGVFVNQQKMTSDTRRITNRDVHMWSSWWCRHVLSIWCIWCVSSWARHGFAKAELDSSMHGLACVELGVAVEFANVSLWMDSKALVESVINGLAR